jgi:hypothetical protein
MRRRAQAFFRKALSRYLPMKASRSALIISACVVGVILTVHHQNWDVDHFEIDIEFGL